MSEWDTFCGFCGQPYLYKSVPVFKHRVQQSQVAYTETILTWCLSCQQEKPCSKNLAGIHGEVLVLSEQEEKGIIVSLDSDHPLFDVPRHQVGWCEHCRELLLWSPRLFRWTSNFDNMQVEDVPAEILLADVPAEILLA